MATLRDYTIREERLRRIHLQFPTKIRASVLELLDKTHPGYTCKMYGPVVDRDTLVADTSQQLMVVEVPE